MTYQAKDHDLYIFAFLAPITSKVFNMFLLNEGKKRNIFCESYLFLLQVVSTLLFNFSHYSSKDIS